MKPAWEQLEKSFEGNNGVAIVDVDCINDVNKDLCSKYGVRGYPTIKYFTDSTDPMGDKYEGGRTYADLKKFADEKTEAQATAEKTFKDEVSKLQKKYEELMKEKDDAVAAASENLGIMRSVLAASKDTAAKDEL